MGILDKVIGGLAGPVVSYLNERQKLRSAERIRAEELKEATHKRQIELISQGLAADANWEMVFANQASSTWKDEYELIIISIPTIMSFIPGLAVYVSVGFEALARTPAWYQTLLITIFLANYGIRFWRRNQSDT